MKKLIKELTEQKIKELESAGLSFDQILDSYEGTKEEKKIFKERKEKELNKLQTNFEEQQSFTSTNQEGLKIQEELKEEIKKIKLTTANQINNYEIDYEIDVITAECVYGMNIFRDVFSAVRDVVGGRSEASQKVLRDLRKTCLLELKAEAYSLEADAVIGVDLDYSEISGGGKSGMLFLVASGTAVKFKK
jgi:uncharacterized protein YbjQ (UPF0145 family)